MLSIKVHVGSKDDPPWKVWCPVPSPLSWVVSTELSVSSSRPSYPDGSTGVERRLSFLLRHVSFPRVLRHVLKGTRHILPEVFRTGSVSQNVPPFSNLHFVTTFCDTLGLSNSPFWSDCWGHSVQSPPDRIGVRFLTNSWTGAFQIWVRLSVEDLVLKGRNFYCCSRFESYIGGTTSRMLFLIIYTFLRPFKLVFSSTILSRSLLCLQP